MADERAKDADQESWTDVEDAPPDLVEALPIRHGMVLGGRYAIERIIGRGGSGVVVRAHDRDLNQVVAIKIVRAELAGQRVWATRLAREVRLARTISHPHVCRVFDFQQADGRVFLVMELAKGTLRDEIRSGASKARPLAERIADARAVASALAAIHAAGIVHRDLSPQNLLRLDDGRLVLSDFGLATESSESTSVHGGTIAYMAPEVMRGEHSTPASDIWSLGALMYEIVFADKPSWSQGTSPEILTPALGRKLTEEERAVLATCRACTVKDPRKRIPSAAWAERMLAERRRWRLPRLAPAPRPIFWASALTVLVAAVVGVMRTREPGQTPPPSVPSDTPIITVSSNPSDWTDVSTVIAETPERITCTRLLPDQRTLRFVWGVPPRAEDIDTVTRKRGRSPLVPAAYAEGCPDLSPDGKRLVYQGHAKDGRAFAFLSETPDGADAVPVVPTAEPTMASEPTWIGDGVFSYDVDARHVGVFSTALRRVTIVPEVPSHAYVTLFRASTSDAVLVSGVFESGHTEVTSVGLPWLKERGRFRVNEFLMDLRPSGGLLYAVGRTGTELTGITEVDPQRRRARRIGLIRGQSLRSPTPFGEWMSFVSTRFDFRLAVRQRDGSFEQIPGGGIISASPCGNDLIVDRRTDGGVVIETLDRSGRFIQRVSDGPISGFASCSPDGRVKYFTEGAAPTVVKRCADKTCRVLAEKAIYGVAVSPDGKRLAFVTLASRGPLVGWMPTDGGASRDVADSETGCPIGWASNTTLWVSRRRDGKILWTEVDADSGKETGKTVPGQRDCSDGGTDPLSPVHPDLRIIASRQSQLRLLPRGYLNRP